MLKYFKLPELKIDVCTFKKIYSIQSICVNIMWSFLVFEICILFASVYVNFTINCVNLFTIKGLHLFVLSHDQHNVTMTIAPNFTSFFCKNQVGALTI